MIQAPLMFELSEGCSVGCPFCGVAAMKLRGVFRYTEEHVALWQETLVFPTLGMGAVVLVVGKILRELGRSIGVA